MKYLSILVALFMVLSGWPGIASAVTTASEEFSEFQKLSLSSAEAHLTHVEILEGEVTQLEEQVKNLNERAQRYKQKPYLDTKGYQRSSLKLLIGNNLSKITNLQQQIVWHREEASRLAALNKSSQESFVGMASVGEKQKTDISRSGSRES